MLRHSFLLCAWFAMATAGFAQVTGSLSGTVTDQNQGAIVNATVKVYLAGGKEPVLTGVTNGSGRFIFAAVNPDTYDVGVEASGFSNFVYRGALVSTRQETGLPQIELKVQGVSEVVEVVADAQAIQLENAAISTTISSVQIQNLPVLGRQVSNLFSTQPGVTSNSGNPQTVNGLRASLTNLTLDGINIQDNFIRTNSLDYAPFRTTIDQIAEITITTTNASAQFGGGASQISMATKSGTNTYHGTVYWYNRNDALSSKDWFSNRDDVAKPKLNINQPGVSLGGPVAISPHKVLHDKLFFFTTYEWFRDKEQSSQTRTVLTDSAKTGVFTYNTTAGVRTTANLRTLKNYIPDPTVAAMIAQLPSPNAPGGDGLNTSGYRFNAVANEFRDQFVYKTDYYLNANNSITGSYNYIDNPTARPDVTSSFYGLQPHVSNSLKNHLLSLQWRWTISPTLTNEVHGGFARTHGNFDVDQAYPKQVLTGLLFTSPVNTFLAQGRDTNTYPIQDNATWIKGSHQVSFGYQYQRVSSNIFNDGGIVPSIALGLSGANTTGLAAADLPGISTSNLATVNALYANLAGIISSGQQTFNVTSASSGFVPGATNRRQVSWTTHALYVQDNWKIRPNLTINAGVRYEYWTPLDEKNGLFLAPRLENNDAKATLLNPNAVLDFTGGPSGRKIYDADKNNFAPNIGFAWDPFRSGKTSIRGGYMIAYVNDNVIQTFRNNVNTNAGLSFTNTITNQVGTLASPPVIAAPTYKVPRTLAENYAITTTAAAGLPQTNLVTPLVHQWNFSIEHDLKGFLVTARYLGNKGTQLLRAVDYNQVLYNANGFLADFKRAQSNSYLSGGSPAYNASIPGSQPLTVFPLLGAGFNINSAANITTIRQGQIGSLADSIMTGRNNGSVNFYANPNLQGANTVTNGGSSNFNSLQFQVTRRTRAGLQVQFSYAYGKGLSNTTGDANTNFEPLLDNANPSLENARTPFDVRHVFKANYIYLLPFGKGKMFDGRNSIVNQVIGGWSLGGIWNYQSGAPFSILSGYGTLNRGARSTTTNTASVAGTTMDQLTPLTSGVFKTGDNIYFLSPTLLNSDGRGTNAAGVSGFAGQVFYNPNAGTLGNLQRRSFTGPWDFAWDMSLIKGFTIHERHKVDLHFDFFNVFNHPTFLMYPVSGDYGVSSVYNINNTFFGQLDSINHDARQIQIGARYSF
ncbi:MAG: TonB-dependent receptor [Acidobacteriota bacterium]